MAKFRVEVQPGSKYEVEAPDEATAWDWANQTHRDEQIKLEEAGKAKGGEYKIGEAGLKDAGRSVVEREGNVFKRTLANLAMGAHKIGQGVGGLVGLGPNQDELRQSNLIKSGAAEASPGGEYVQMAGEIAPTLLLPGGIVASGARRLGAKGVERVLQKSLAARAADLGVTGAAVNAATTPGDWQDRAYAGAFGTLGAAAPVLGAVGKGTARVFRGGSGREASVAERMVRDIGSDKADELVAKLDAPAHTEEFRRAGVQNPSAAAVTADPTLLEAELGLRTNRGSLFTPGDELAAKERWDKLGEIAGDDTALAKLEGTRKTTTTPMRDEALAATRQVPGFATPVSYQVEQILTGESRTNPQARKLANWVQSELGEGVTPEQLYTMRKTLTSGIPHGTELGSAMMQARGERVALVAAIDESLQAASGGKWKEYMEKFKELSGPVTSMKAGQRIQDTFASKPQTLTLTDNVPIIQPFALRKALEKHGEKQFGSKTFQRVTPQERQTIESIAKSIELENAAKKAQGIVGSDTAGKQAARDRVSDQIARTVAHTVAGGGVGGIAADYATTAFLGKNKLAREEALFRLLQDPKAMRDALAAARTTALRDTAYSGGAARLAREAPQFIGQ